MSHTNLCMLAAATRCSARARPQPWKASCVTASADTIVPTSAGCWRATVRNAHARTWHCPCMCLSDMNSHLHGQGGLVRRVQLLHKRVLSLRGSREGSGVLCGTLLQLRGQSRHLLVVLHIHRHHHAVRRGGGSISVGRLGCPSHGGGCSGAGGWRLQWQRGANGCGGSDRRDSKKLGVMMTCSSSRQW